MDDETRKEFERLDDGLFRLESLTLGYINEIFNWLRHIMPEDFNFKEASDRLDRINDDNYDR